MKVNMDAHVPEVVAPGDAQKRITMRGKNDPSNNNVSEHILLFINIQNYAFRSRNYGECRF
jgi:hypothetical protein